jgi:hypothetical protein
MLKNLWNLVLGFAGLVAIALLATLPATWMLMLFFGNVGAQWSYWAVLPLGAVVSVLIGAAGNNETTTFLVRDVS